MSDGSAIFVFPIVQEPDAPEDEGLPELADWELLSPRDFSEQARGCSGISTQ